MKKHTRLIFLIFAVVAIVAILMFLNSMTIRGTVVAMIGKPKINGTFDTFLIDVESSGRIDCKRVYLNYKGTTKLSVGDKIIALCNPHILASDPPYVFAAWLFRIG